MVKYVFFKYLKSMITFKPWPLSKEWEKLENKYLIKDIKAPVNLIDIKFYPNRFFARKVISVAKINFLVEELSDCLIYYSSRDAINKGSYLYVDISEENWQKDFEVTIKLIKKKKGKKNYLISQIFYSNEQINESFELSVTRSLKNILRKYMKLSNLGLSLTFAIQPAHKRWKIPSKFKDLSF